MTINHITANDVDTFTENPSFDRYQEIATKSANYPGKNTSLGLMYLTSKLASEAGEAAQHVSKAFRDDEGVLLHIGTGRGGREAFSFGALSTERRYKLIDELGDELWYIAAICKELDITLEDVASSNLAKLYRRTATNKLQGSGDNR